MKKILIFIISILTTLSLYGERVLKEMIIVYDKIKVYNLKELIKFSYSNTDFLLILILTIALIFFYNKYADIKKSKAYNILSIFFTFFLVFGFSYSVLGNSSLVTGNIILIIISLIKFITYYIFLSTLINLIAIKLKKIDLSKIKVPKIFKRFEKYYEKHPYKTTILILLICWLPYIISFYPSILSPDPSNQIKQYFGIATHYVEGVNLINPNVLITNHHPVFHTFILGGFAKIGDSLGSINLGLFLFTCFQAFIVISALTYTLAYLKKLKMPFIYRLVVLLIFALVPVFPLYALSCVKDTMFGAVLIFYIIEVHKLLTTSNYKTKDYIILSLLLLILMLVRNNGIYIILISFLSLIFVLKDKRKSLIAVLIASIFIYEAHNRILLPTMNISMGSIREMLSVPFQQTARYVKYHSEDLSEEEKEIIDKLLGYDTLAERYKPNIADPVKNEFNKDTTTEDLMNYFKVWFMCFFRHPGTYFNATINTVYGYFYPNTSNWYVYHEYDTRLIESGINYHYNSLKIPRNILSSFGVAYPYIPILGAIVNIGLIIWTYMYLLAFLIHENKKRLITLILPAFILLLTCIVGPVNTYFRYMFPLLISLPLIVGLIYQESRKN
ncbi:MAG: DUF6020 family protein [Ruminococcus sp.]|nr:DUF6020 family protein [Ruminococcus sp.]